MGKRSTWRIQVPGRTLEGEDRQEVLDMAVRRITHKVNWQEEEVKRWRTFRKSEARQVQFQSEKPIRVQFPAHFGVKEEQTKFIRPTQFCLRSANFASGEIKNKIRSNYIQTAYLDAPRSKSESTPVFENTQFDPNLLETRGQWTDRRK